MYISLNLKKNIVGIGTCPINLLFAASILDNCQINLNNNTYKQLCN